MADVIFRKIEEWIEDGNYELAWSYIRQLQRTDVLISELPPNAVEGIEVTVSTGRVPDAVVNMADGLNPQAPPVKVLFEVKKWPADLLENKAAVDSLAKQLQGFLDAKQPDGTPYGGVVVEFVEHSEDPITTVGQITDALKDANLDMSRLDIRVVNYGDPATKEFVPLQAPANP